MAKRLWDVVDGEPFMINPRIGLLNPRGGKMRRVRRSKKKNSPPRRRRKNAPARLRRRNPWPVGGMVAMANPRRRKRNPVHRRGKKRNPRRYRRNPASLSIAGFRIPPMKQILFAGVGFIAPPMVEGFIAGYLPASMQPSPDNKVATYAIRIASVVGLTLAVGKLVGREEARMTAIGGSVYIASAAIRDFAPSIASQIGLSAYVPSNGGFGAYTPVQRSFGLGAGGDNVRPFTANAIDAAVPSRFKRF